MYVGLDGVMVPTITETEKAARRKKVLEKRRRCGRNPARDSSLSPTARF